MHRLQLAIVLVAIGLACAAGPTPPPVRAEIDALLSRLQASGCQFNRNGSWYGAEEAKAHLLRKLEYLEGRSTIQSAEQFIELAGSSSSSSGLPYQVKCGTAPPVPSRQWLNAELVALRSAARNGTR